MPFDGNKWNMKKMVPYQEMVEIIQKKWPHFERVQDRDTANDTSKVVVLVNCIKVAKK